jgi:hypothetical protein
VEDEIEHLGEGERHHDEIDAFHADDQRADCKRAERGGEDGRGKREPQARRFVLGCEERERVRADAVERRMAERDEPRVADQQVERQRENRKDHYLGDELRIERRSRQWEERQQSERETHGDAPRDHRAAAQSKRITPRPGKCLPAATAEPPPSADRP